MRRTYRYLILFFWMLVIFYLSSEGHDASSGRSNEIVDAVKQVAVTVPTDLLSFIVRKSAHTVAYFVLGMLALLVAKSYKTSLWKAAALSIEFACIYAISDEFHQSFVPGRTAMGTDVLIDTTAASLGVTILYFAIRDIRGKKVNNKV